jgi:quercetin dioxygenase-like cupin family protein
METQFELKNPFRLADALNYIKGQVEFRTIMSSHNGSVDLVSLQADSHLAEHPAPEDVLVYLIEGEVDFHVDDHIQRMAPGDSMLLPKGVLHSVKPLRDSKVMLIKIRP